MLTPKKVLVSLVLATLGFVACATKAPPSAPPPPPPVAAAPAPSAAPSAAPSDTPDDEEDAESPQTSGAVTAQNVTFTLPTTGTWHQMEPPADEIISMWRDSNDRILMFVTKDVFQGNTQTLSLLAMKGMKQSGSVLSALKHVKLNGKDFILLSATRGGMKISDWMIVDTGFAYNLMCGGPADSATALSTCQAVANSLKIK